MQMQRTMRPSAWFFTMIENGNSTYLGQTSEARGILRCAHLFGVTVGQREKLDTIVFSSAASDIERVTNISIHPHCKDDIVPSMNDMLKHVSKTESGTSPCSLLILPSYIISYA
jgi:hypothetical protein